jgi:predicted nucleotidyltransferase
MITVEKQNCLMARTFSMAAQAIQKNLREITDKIVKKFQPRMIVLFGSYAWGEPGPDSDVDLLVVKDTENTRKTAMEIDGFLFPRPFPIDLIVYTSQQVERRQKAGDFFINDILRKGKVLYAR